MRRIPTGQLADARPHGRAHPQTARRPSQSADYHEENLQRGRICVRRGQQRRLLPMVRDTICLLVITLISRPIHVFLPINLIERFD